MQPGEILGQSQSFNCEVASLRVPCHRDLCHVTAPVSGLPPPDVQLCCVHDFYPGEAVLQFKTPRPLTLARSQNLPPGHLISPGQLIEPGH